MVKHLHRSMDASTRQLAAINVPNFIVWLESFVYRISLKTVSQSGKCRVPCQQ